MQRGRERPDSGMHQPAALRGVVRALVRHQNTLNTDLSHKKDLTRTDFINKKVYPKEGTRVRIPGTHCILTQY